MSVRTPLSRLAVAQVLVTLAVASIALAIALTHVLDSKQRLAGTNSVPPDAFVVEVAPRRPVCQSHVLVQKGAAGVSVFTHTFAEPAPPLSVTVKDASPPLLRRGVAEGYRDGGWAVARFPRVDATTTVDRVCFETGTGRVALGGQGIPNAGPGKLTAGKRKVPSEISLNFVREHKQTLAGLAPTVFHRASLFRPGWVAPWTYWGLLILTLALIAAAPASLFLYRRRRPPLRVALAGVAAIAFLNAATWGLVMPTFSPPDEAAHYAYVESLVERGHRPLTTPVGGEGSYTNGTTAAIEVAGLPLIKGPLGKPPWTRAEESGLDAALRRLGDSASQRGGGWTPAAGYSPVYYALEAGPYVLGRSGSIFTRMWLMRLLSALMAAATAAFAFVFARELVPSVDWVAPTAALAVAFQPMFAFVGGSVNNDNLLILLATIELYLLARALRRGLDDRLAAAIAVVLGLGIAAKPTMWAVVPLAVAVLAWVLFRDRKVPRPPALRIGAIALGSFAAVVALRYALFAGDDAVAEAVNRPSARPFQLRELLSYTWQWYLPKLSFMNERFFPGYSPLYDVYVKGFWANFGQLDTYFVDRVYRILVWVTLGASALVGVAVFRARRSLATVLPRVALGVGAVASIALLVNVRSYLALLDANVSFAQGRYLLPVIAVFGATVAGAALAFGRRNGIVAATGAVLALACFNAFSLGLALTRFYT
jgi:hypothetical protein